MSIDDGISADSSGVFDRGASDQYLSDSNIDPGTDTDLCTQDTGSLSVHYRAGKLDAYADNRIYEQTVV